MEEVIRNAKKLGKKLEKRNRLMLELPPKLYEVDQTEKGKLYFGNLPSGFDVKKMKLKIEKRFGVKITAHDRMCTREDGQVFLPEVELNDTTEALRLILIREPSLKDMSGNQHQIDIRPFQNSNPQKTGKRISLSSFAQKVLQVMKSTTGSLPEFDLLRGIQKGWNEMRKQGDDGVCVFLPCIPHIIHKAESGEWLLTPQQEPLVKAEMFTTMVRQVFLVFQTNQMDLLQFVRAWAYLHRTYIGPKIIRRAGYSTITELLKTCCTVGKGNVSPLMNM